jgi:hypothetical protein
MPIGPAFFSGYPIRLHPGVPVLGQLVFVWHRLLWRILQVFAIPAQKILA